MIQQKLQVYLRIKPSQYSYKNQNLSYVINDTKLIIQTNRVKLSSIKQQLQYNFKHIFEQQTTQNQIFISLAKPVIDNCLKGYNGTIFAYGQTGSGKTYTMSGGDEWEERGIIPRVLSYIFSQFQKYKEAIRYQLSVSYIEIYNQNAYDLLDENNTQDNFQQWPKITLFQDDENKFCSEKQNRKKSQKFCASQQQALDKLMMGNYLRKVSCTNLNQASSRSHCIFVLNIKGTDLKNQKSIYSKINLVDLAGSQRVSKSHASGVVLTQAKSINLSLSFLQQVIISLNNKSKHKQKQKYHIPYRNSLLTILLKDSLGGNCKTVMITSISNQLSNQQQTLSTLKFSQRVKQIKNNVHKNQSQSIETKMQMLQRQNLILNKRLKKYQSDAQQNNYKRTDSQQIKLDLNQRISEQYINEQICDFMNQKLETIELAKASDTGIYFIKMKQYHKEKMRQYASELKNISEKIINYQRMLDQRERKNGQGKIVGNNNQRVMINYNGNNRIKQINLTKK